MRGLRAVLIHSGSGKRYSSGLLPSLPSLHPAFIVDDLRTVAVSSRRRQRRQQASTYAPKTLPPPQLYTYLHLTRSFFSALGTSSRMSGTSHTVCGRCLRLPPDPPNLPQTVPRVRAAVTTTTTTTTATTPRALRRAATPTPYGPSPAGVRASSGRGCSAPSRAFNIQASRGRGCRVNTRVESSVQRSRMLRFGFTWRHADTRYRIVVRMYDFSISYVCPGTE